MGGKRREDTSIYVKGCGQCLPPLLTPVGWSTYIVICVIIIIRYCCERARKERILLYEPMTCGTRKRDLVVEGEELGERERNDCAE